jgi:periplasmic protein CpxP/Spy
MIRRHIAGILGAAVLVAGSAAALVHAQAPDGQGPPPAHQRRGPGGPGGPGGFFGRGFGGPGEALGLLRQLDLTDEQRAQVRQVMESHRDELRAIGEKVMAAHRAQNDVVTAPTFDENAIRAKAAELAAVEADAAVLHAKLHGEVFAILTPEQQAKAAELKVEREARMQRVREQMKQRIQERRQRRAPAAE